jgi:hypothetical protein
MRPHVGAMFAVHKTRIAVLESADGIAPAWPAGFLSSSAKKTAGTECQSAGGRVK